MTFDELTMELIQKAVGNKSSEELIEIAKKQGVILNKEQAEAYISEYTDCELDNETLRKVAGGVCWDNCPKESQCSHHVCGTVGWENFKGC